MFIIKNFCFCVDFNLFNSYKIFASSNREAFIFCLHTDAFMQCLVCSNFVLVLVIQKLKMKIKMGKNLYPVQTTLALKFKGRTRKKFYSTFCFYNFHKYDLTEQYVVLNEYCLL